MGLSLSADRPHRALTLMEVILGLGLFAVAIVALFTALMGGIGMQSKAEVVELASSVARQQIEAMKAAPATIREGDYDGRAPTPGVDGFPPAPYPTIKRGRDFWLLLQVRAQDERLWYVRVKVYSSRGEETSMETYLKR